MKLFPCSLALALAPWVLAGVGCSTSGAADPSSTKAAERFDIEVQLITGSAEACERVLDTKSGTRVVSSAEAKKILAAAASSCGIVSRPRISVAAGATAFVITTTKTGYVQDFDADAHPVMGSIEHGVRIAAIPKATEDAKSELALSIDVSGLQSPIRQRDVTLPGSGKIVTVQLPELEVVKIRTSIVLGDDDVALVPLDRTPGDDPVRTVVLRVHRRA